jgi:LysM repeat protein
VPTPTPQVAVTYYKTHEGDTVQSVADQFRVAAKDLAKANGITVDTPLEAGTVLVIPLSDTPPQITGSPTPVPPGAGTPGA